MIFRGTLIRQASFQSPHLIILIKVQDRRETARYVTQMASLPFFDSPEIVGEIPKLFSSPSGTLIWVRNQMQSLPLMDAIGFTRYLEEKYRWMWETYLGRNR